MAHFIGKVQGSRGGVHRLGHKTSGINVVANGWNKGIAIYGYYDKDTQTDKFKVYLTGGTNNTTPSKEIGIF